MGNAGSVATRGGVMASESIFGKKAHGVYFDDVTIVTDVL